LEIQDGRQSIGAKRITGTQQEVIIATAMEERRKEEESAREI
jgi:hypothetical protein